ncbi:hypothetical protein [Streptococcus hyointestinalis]|uniref:hypothetical protein n=1 Tax=Streptococcus hyointestinalis TaxID=1337 RepID=UPI003F998730
MKHGNEFYVERKLSFFGIIPVGKVKVHRAFAEVNTFTEEEPAIKKEREIDVELSKYNEKQRKLWEELSPEARDKLLTLVSIQGTNYIKTPKDDIEKALLDLDCIEYVNDIMYNISEGQRKEEHLLAAYDICFNGEYDWLTTFQLWIYHKDGEAVSYGISNDMIPNFVNSKEEMHKIIDFFSDLPFSITFEKVVFDWESELRELETDGSSIYDVEVANILSQKEQELVDRIGNYRYRVSFPEYRVRTLDECVDLFIKLDKNLKEVVTMKKNGEMD